MWLDVGKSRARAGAGAGARDFYLSGIYTKQHFFDVSYDTNLLYGKLRCRSTEKNCLPKACSVRRQKIEMFLIFCRPS
jgi:hypothetical protein